MYGIIINILEWLAGIIASLIVVFGTQLINDRYFSPKQELRNLLRKVVYTLDYYALIIDNPGAVDKETEKEAMYEVRKVAMELMTFTANYPKMKYKHLSAKDLESLGPDLVGISNSIGIINPGYSVYDALQRIRRIICKEWSDVH